MCSKAKVFHILAHAYTFLKAEFLKPVTARFPKIKDYLSKLVDITLNYSKLMFQEPDFILGGSSPTAIDLQQFLGKSLCDYAINSDAGYPKEFLDDLKPIISIEEYNNFMCSFYVQILGQMKEVRRKHLIRIEIHNG